MKRRIVFVCAGNTCRSPMAETLLKDSLRRNGVIGYSVTSCGLCPVAGAPIDVRAVNALREIGLSAPRRCARAWAHAYSSDGAAVIALTAEIKNSLSSGNAYSLAELTDGIDCPDPFCGGMDDYRTVRDRLRGQIERLVPKLESLFPPAVGGGSEGGFVEGDLKI